MIFHVTVVFRRKGNFFPPPPIESGWRSEGLDCVQIFPVKTLNECARINQSRITELSCVLFVFEVSCSGSMGLNVL